jgi:hypothetical protein
MKKLILSMVVATTIFACQPKTETASAIPANASGYNVDSSANTEIVKKVLDAGLSYDTATTKMYYVDTVTIHDNNTKQTLHENMQIAGYLKSKGATVKIERLANIWESVLKTPDTNGTTSYVHTYMVTSLSRGDKKIEVIMHAVFAFNAGKIVQEWDIYDTREIAELLK